MLLHGEDEPDDARPKSQLRDAQVIPAGREPHWRASKHSPAVGANRNGAPMLIGKIKIEPASMLGDARIDRALGTIKLRAGFEQIER